jgi:hypothetical protein
MEHLLDLVELPDVVAEPYPTPHALAPEAGAGKTALQDVMPEMKELAEKVGGYKNLADLAYLAEQMDNGSDGK